MPDRTSLQRDSNVMFPPEVNLAVAAPRHNGSEAHYDNSPKVINWKIPFIRTLWRAAILACRSLHPWRHHPRAHSTVCVHFQATHSNPAVLCYASLTCSFSWELFAVCAGALLSGGGLMISDEVKNFSAAPHML